MGWFDRQIRQRMQSDQNVFEESFVRLAGAVLGGRSEKQLEDHFLIAREALEEILKFYRCKAAEVPDSIRDADGQMEYILRPLGIMTRTVTLEEGWYKDAFGPMMGFLKEGGAPVALLPHPLHGYCFRDPATARRVRLSRKTAALFDHEAICFYKPLPQKKLGIPDLLLYMKNCLSSNDYTLIALATLAMTLVGMLVTQASKAITGPVLKSGSTSMRVGMAIFLLSAAFSAELLGVVRQLMMSRINTKTSLQVEAAVMTRVLSLPVSFFRQYASGDLASRVSSVNSLCEMLVSQIMSTGLTSLTSLLYISQIFSFAPLLVWPSIVIILITVILGAVFSLMQVKLVAYRTHATQVDQLYLEEARRAARNAVALMSPEEVDWFSQGIDTDGFRDAREHAVAANDPAIIENWLKSKPGFFRDVSPFETLLEDYQSICAVLETVRDAFPLTRLYIEDERDGVFFMLADPERGLLGIGAEAPDIGDEAEIHADESGWLCYTFEFISLPTEDENIFEAVAYAFADINMNHVMEQRHWFLYSSIVLIVVLTGAAIVIGMLAVHRIAVKPLRLLRQGTMDFGKKRWAKPEAASTPWTT